MYFVRSQLRQWGLLARRELSILSANHNTRASDISGEPRDGPFYCPQRLSIIIQRGNAASFKGSFGHVLDFPCA